ncbi:amine oxidase [Mycolicibacterium rhodesiae JS60]|nr:amine oxidase [Mycolicibacterium rhodesiae JS60]
MGAKPSAVVIGSGLSGLAAAYHLQRDGWNTIILESEPVPGGRVQTLRAQGYVVDLGATAVGAGYDAYLGLARQLGLEMVVSPPWIGVARDGTVHELRVDQLLRSGVSTQLLSAASKLRMTRLAFGVAIAKLRGRLDYTDLSKAAPIDTETAYTYAIRTLGAEAAEYAVAPLTRTMVIVDPQRTSKVELFSGVANALGGEWQSPAGGAASIVDALVQQLDVRLGCPARCVTETPQGVLVEYAEPEGHRAELVVDACVVACPLPAAVAICPERRDVLEPLHAALPYTKTICVAVGTTRQPPCRAFMVMLPPAESREIALFFQDHHKDPARVLAGHGLFSLYFELAAAEALFDAPDEAVIEIAVDTLLRLWPELRDTIDFTHVHRWAQALPHPKVGTYQRIAEFNAALDPTDRIQFAADYMSEAGQNTAVVVGNRAARNLQRHYSAAGRG